jgi:hypothetical protein
MQKHDSEAAKRWNSLDLRLQNDGIVRAIIFLSEATEDVVARVPKGGWLPRRPRNVTEASANQASPSSSPIHGPAPVRPIDESDEPDEVKIVAVGNSRVVNGNRQFRAKWEGNQWVERKVVELYGTLTRDDEVDSDEEIIERALIEDPTHTGQT